MKDVKSDFDKCACGHYRYWHELTKYRPEAQKVVGCLYGEHECFCLCPEFRYGEDDL